MARAEHALVWNDVVVALDGARLVSFGRSKSCDLVLPDDDLLLSRHAGEVHVRADHLEVVNTSGSRELRLRPPVGEDVVVRPGGSATSRGMPVFTILLAGQYGTTYSIACRGPGARSASADDEGTETRVRPFELTGPEQRMLQALCRPMLIRNGEEAVPATYGEVAEDLGASEGYVRNVLKGVRDRLTEFGVPGLAAAGSRSRATDFRRPLCDFAVANGWAYGD